MDTIWKALESITSAVVAQMYRRNIAGTYRLSRLSWALYDRCPAGYKGKIYR